MTIHRRRFLALAPAALATLPLSRRAFAADDTALPPPGPPVARIEVVRDTYFGETLADPYRWMENAQDKDWLPFLRAQNAHARRVGALTRRLRRRPWHRLDTGAAGRGSGRHVCVPVESDALGDSDWRYRTVGLRLLLPAA